MYRDDIKMKNNWKPKTGSEDIRWRYWDGIYFRKMYHANNELRKTSNDGGNRTTKSRNNQNIWKEGNLQLLSSGHYQTSGDEKKKERKNNTSENEKITRN